MHARLLAGVAVIAACLGPQVSDEVDNTGLILPAGAVVPSIETDPEEAAAIAANDGVDGVVPLYTAFSDGLATSYWNFGSAPDFSQPAFLLYRRNGEELERLPHPLVIAEVPGEPGYSPFGQLRQVEVTGAYRGELFPSVEAGARRRGRPGASALFAARRPRLRADTAYDVEPKLFARSLRPTRRACRRRWLA